MAAGRQIRLLLWKDYLIRKRNLITLGGVVWAVCVMFSLYLIRANINNYDYPSCQFPARALPSAGVLTFLQSFICSVDNTCSPMDEFVEIPSYEKSKLTELKSEILPLISNDTLLDVAGMLPDGLKLLATLAEVADHPTFVDLSRNGLRVDKMFRNPKRVRRYLASELDLEDEVANSVVDAKISLQGVLQSRLDKCNVYSISKVLRIENEEHAKIFVSKLCTLSKKVIQKLVIDLLPQLDIGKYVKMVGDMYYKISGDDSITQMGDMATAVVRMISVNSFLPPELITLLKGEESDFTYVNLTMITKALNTFEPVFGETEAYKTIRDFVDMSVGAIKYLYKIANNLSHNSTVTATDLTWTNATNNVDIDLELNKISDAINNAINTMQDIFKGDSSDNIFNVLSKVTNFMYNLLSARTKHYFLFFSTLAAKLIEGAELVVNINMNIEQVVYNVSQRNPDGVKVLLALPPNVVSMGLEALADPERIQYLTDKMDELEKMFCDVNEIHSFFKISMEEAAKLHVHFCTDAWNHYMLDMLKSFGIFDVRDNINSIARIFVLETIGRDVTEFLYTIDKDFDILKNFSITLSKVEMYKVPNLNWSKVLGIHEDSEILKNAREKSHLGNQILITVNGALAKEVVRQSPLLEYKISNPLIDGTVILIAINNLLATAPPDVIKKARDSYRNIIKTVLLTALDEDKTYRALATPSEDMLCKGVENARTYINLSPSENYEMEDLVATLCKLSTIINNGLTRDSLLGKAIATVRNTTHGPFDDIDWSVLITELKQLYIKLDTEYPYLFEYKTYGMDNATKHHVDEMFGKAQEFWFSKKSIKRSIHVSIKLGLRLLDLLDSGALNLTTDSWLRLKDAISSAVGPMTVVGDFLKLVGAIARNDNATTNVPPSTATALRRLVPNLPRLIVDSVDVVVKGDTDIEPIMVMMNSDPPWPCSHNLTQVLRLSDRAQEALGGLETILCMERQLQKEWADYIDEKNLTAFNSPDWNTTVYPPHLFLQFSEVFTTAVEDLDALKDFLQSLFNLSDGISFVSSIEYAIDSFNTSEKHEVIRNFFANVDQVLNAINTTSVEVAVPLNTLWRNYFHCSTGPYIEDYCGKMGRAAWKHTMMFASVMLENVAEDLLTYFTEANEANTNVLKMFGFTSGTGLYALYHKFPEFVGVLLNSYWDLGFMNQVRRASLTEFWDCEAVVGALTPPPGSPINHQTIASVKPFICPSLLYWISLPRGDNILLDVIAKPQYFFFTMQADKLTSSYENAFIKTSKLTDFVAELAKRPVAIHLGDDDEYEERNEIDNMRNYLDKNVDEVLTFKIAETNPSYRLFNEVNRKQFVSYIYLTRITAIVNKLSNALEGLEVDRMPLEGFTEHEIKQMATELIVIQRMFKRRPNEVIALHFDVLTDVIWNNDENYTLADALAAMCDNLKSKDTSKDILSDTDSVKLQICSKKFDLFYKAVQNQVEDDVKMTRQSLLYLVNMLQNNFTDDTIDIFKFFNHKQQVISSLKRSIKYAYDLGIPVYLQYLHSNVQQYGVVLSFLTGDDWWQALRDVYAGPRVTTFINTVERSFDIAQDILTNLDKIHLVRLFHDVNVKSSEDFCRDNVSLGDYVPDGTELLTSLKHQACNRDIELIREIPPMLFASQGYVADLKLSDEVNYTLIYSDLTNTESKLSRIQSGPKEPQRPRWITDEKIGLLKKTIVNLLLGETLTKISFGVLANLVDAGTLFMNNSQCTLCSQFTSWFKQINLQLYKKQEYDNLLCHMDQMSLDEIYISLKNDFHWDMAISELISTRNYTKYELNKSMNEFLELVKLHLLEDVTSDDNKMAQCLASNVTRSPLGNVTLFVHVLTHTSRLIRAELPHLQEIPGIKDLKYFKKLQSTIAHNLDAEDDLKNVLKKNHNLSKGLMKIVGDKAIVEDIENARVNLRTVREIRPTDQYLRLKRFNWTEICENFNCNQILAAVGDGVDWKLVEQNLPRLQKRAFWQFDHISNLLAHEEQLLGHVARLLGAVSRANLFAVAEGRLLPTIDLGMQLLTEESLDSIVYSLRGVLEQLQPILAGTGLEYDVNALASGLVILRQFRNYLLEKDLNVPVSELFPNPERIESDLTDLGINNTNFWSIAAPRIQAGHIMLTPIFAPKEGVYHIENFVCNVDDMSKVIIPENVDVVTLDDVYGAVIEQFCGLSDDQVKDILPVLLDNLNYTFIFDKIKTAVISHVFSSSNLSQHDGDNVLAHFEDMVSVLPDIQERLNSLADNLASEPLIQKFRNSSSINTLVSSPSFMTDAGNMMCGHSFNVGFNNYYKAISKSQDQSRDPDEAQLQVLPTDFCRSLYKEIVRMKGGKILWSFAKPLILGKILYTPDTPTVQRIIKKASSVFAPAIKISELVHSFADAFFSIEKLTKHKDGITVLTKLLSSPEYAELRNNLIGDVEIGRMDVDQLIDGLGDIQGYKNMLRKASELLRCINLDRFQPVKDEEELKLQAGRLTRINEFSAGIVFLNTEEDGDIPENIEYKIRMDIENAPTTRRIKNYLWIPGPESNFIENMRYFRGFVQIQDIIDKAIIELSVNTSKRLQKRAIPEDKEFNWAIYTQQIPYPCVRLDSFQTTLYETQSLMVAFFFSMLFTVASAVRFIVADKESGNTMLMSIMGVKLRYHTLSWFLMSLLEVTMTVVGMVAVLVLGGVLPRTDPSLLFVMLLLYAFSVVCFCYMMSKMFTAASFAAVCTGLGILITYMPFVLILSLEGLLSSPLKVFVCLFMSSAMTYGMWFITRFEAMGVGGHWSQLWDTMEGSEITMAYAMAMVVVDALIYAAVGYLIDRLFGFQARHNNINCSTTGEKAGVSIVNVTKIYNEKTRRAKVALDNVSIELEKGQITTLLGHNGAGKTTLINILTGMLKPTKGHVVVRSEQSLARLGVCPQKDVLFEYMTAREHVAMYAQLKSGNSLDDVRDEVESILTVLSLGAVAEEPVTRLSGGTRRRLCVALAFVARPSLVSLDEPTSGVDPGARREIWSMIMKLRENRTILLTTHHLDEAELLSDQIVIMHKGQIHTTGSPIDIKRSLGTGYKLTVMFPDRRLHISDDDLDEDVCIEEKTKQLLAVTRNVIKNANLVDVSGLEVEVNLPFYDADGVSNNFLELCKALETDAEVLGYRSFALDCSSLEQVFFQICQQTDAPKNPSDYEPSGGSNLETASKSASSSSLKMDREPLVPTGSVRGSTVQQFLALMRARYLHYTRNRWLLFMLIILPSLFVAIAMAFSTIRPPADTELSLKLHRDIYEPTTDFIVPQPSIYSDNMDETLTRQVMDILKYEKEYRNWTIQDSPTCQCINKVIHQCDVSNTTTDRPKMLVLPDVSTLNNWLVDSQQVYIQKRYGGFSSAIQNNRSQLVAWYNNKGHHALPIYVNALNVALLRATSGRSRAGITLYTHPLKISNEQLSRASAYQHVADAGISCMLLLGYSLVIAGSAVYLVAARKRQEKRLQLLCGVSPTLYWVVALVWDMMIILINLAITMLVLGIFRFPVFVHGNNLAGICMLVVLFGYAGSCLVHVLEKLFSEPSMANMIVFCGNVFVGFTGITLLLILDIISESEMTDNARWMLHKVLLLCPQFALGDGLLQIATNTVQSLVLKQFGMDTYQDPVTSPLVRYHYMALLGVGTLLFLLNLAIEYDCFEVILVRFRKQPHELLWECNDQEESEVRRERERVRGALDRASQPLRLCTIGNINDGFVETEVESKTQSVKRSASRDVATCEHLGKAYPALGGPRLAVRNLTLGIPAGQCTALLGQNGAGKSTTFAMLTGEVRPTVGHIYLDDQPVDNRGLCNGLISYCPQSDAVDPLLTVTETLQLYCQLRGVARPYQVIRRTLEMFELSGYARTAAGALSGGNRRKLCTAVAFMGRAPLVLLDEPTSGMDPASRACVSRGVRMACASGRAVLLSTHALDDARRLAARVALMRAGRLCALAPLDECLRRFGGGYIVACRVRRGSARAAWVRVRARASHAVLRILHRAAVHFLLPVVATVDKKQVTTQLSDVFSLMAELQAACEIEDYTVNQSSLDQMFLNFTEKTNEDLDIVELEPLPETHLERRLSDELDSVTAL